MSARQRHSAALPTPELTRCNTRGGRPGRAKDTALAAYDAAKDTGSQRLDALGLSRDKAEETIRNLLGGVADAAKASANAALDAARNPESNPERG